jgi:hypothetical protein
MSVPSVTAASCISLNSSVVIAGPAMPDTSSKASGLGLSTTVATT